MSNFDNLLLNLPEVEHPKRHISFDEKFKWTGTALIIYFILGMIPLYGLDPTYEAQFETLSVLLAASFGSLITLGIGPIVTASIILQLLKGADIIKIDVNTTEGKQRYQGLQKLFSIGFIIFENGLYVMSGALPPAQNSTVNLLLLILQLIAGGILLLLLDEVVSKWGIGSGISLFIAAGVSQEIFVNAFSFLTGPTGLPVGQIPLIISLLITGNIGDTLFPIITIIATLSIFVMAVYLQSVKITIPLSFGRVRGCGIKWPLKFIYTSNIPVILVAAFIASLQFWGLILAHAGIPFLGTFTTQSTTVGTQEVPASGLVKYLQPPRLSDLMTYGFFSDIAMQLLVYSSFLLGGSILFSVLWVYVGGQDAATVSQQILSSGLSVPGFRRDPRILERILDRYIRPLAIMGGFSVGLLAVVADLFNSLSRGTGILLAVIIIYDLYERVQREYATNAGSGLLQKIMGVR